MPDGLVWFEVMSFWNSPRTLFVNYFRWYDFMNLDFTKLVTDNFEIFEKIHYFCFANQMHLVFDIFPIDFIADYIIVFNFIWFCIWLFDHLTNPIGHINFDCTGLSRLSELLKFSRSKSYTQQDWCQSYCPSVV